ncbi:efflux RND transporter permease subunit [Pseudogemmobacter sonorensis]|uniref:efflux RND transporter permease subunit n=1 Tax=Pseudogemmobacter sonorensis TaxID=2989681 RepID=UPI00368E705C
MEALIAAAFARTRTTLLLLALVLIGGVFSYVTISKEASPEIEIPYFTVNITYPGISAQDSARLLIEPMERRLQSIDGLRNITGQAGEGFASILLEFRPGQDQAKAYQDVRDEVDNATPDLPAGANAPVVREIDLSIFPILTVALSGAVPERELIQMGRDLAREIEGISGVLRANLSGDREDLLEIIVNPLAMQSYGISGPEVAQAVQANNQLVAAGAFDTGAGRVSVSIPGTIQSLADVLAMPVRVSEGTVVRVQDVAEVRQSYRDPVTFARLDGQGVVGVDITKVSGANVLDTVAAVQAVVEEARADWPATVSVNYMQNQAEDISTMLGDLENSVILAVLMVMLPTILVLGLRASALIGIAIPGAFFGGILVINLLGFTLNIVVLFGLILVIGMLVDGAMVVVEKAERLQSEGMSGPDAFRQSAQRMAWPVIAAIGTSLAVFFPLLFWPGIAGRFMFYLPATVLITLTVSLLMALIFVPVVGGLMARARTTKARPEVATPAFYRRILDYTLPRPGLTLGIVILAFLLSLMAYGRFGKGSEFFPSVEPERAQIQVKADGNLSVWEADRLVRLVENEVIGTEGLKLTYSRTIGSVEARLSSNVDPDVIGTIQMDLADWRSRPSAREILETLRQKTAHLPGIGIQIEEQEQGLGSARPVEIELSSPDNDALFAASRQLIALMEAQGGFTEISSDVPQPGVEVRIEINREQAARYGVDVATLGNTVRLMTNGVTLGSYLPPQLDDEVDIVLRFPAQERHVAQLGLVRVLTPGGMIPLSNFVTAQPGHAPSVINHSGGESVQTVTAGLAPGLTVATELERLGQAIAAEDFGAVTVRFAGEIEDQQETVQFLGIAFVLAIFLMFMVMLTQLNSFFQSFLVLSAIICSVPGVLLVLMLSGSAFSIVMGGMGVMALAGVVVNNNIILIDAYNEHRRAGLGPDEAAARAAGERLRPILLTALTTVTGLLPMAMGLTIDFFARDAYFGAPSGQFWVQLSTTIVGGLLVGTVITSCLTPTLLAWDGRRRLRKAAPASAEAPG